MGKRVDELLYWYNRAMLPDPRTLPIDPNEQVAEMERRLQIAESAEPRDEELMVQLRALYTISIERRELAHRSHQCILASIYEAWMEGAPLQIFEQADSPQWNCPSGLFDRLQILGLTSIIAIMLTPPEVMRILIGRGNANQLSRWLLQHNLSLGMPHEQLTTEQFCQRFTAH